MNNNRKHVRVSYEKQVELIAEGQTLVAKSIDISNSGIKVIVNVPVNHLSVHRIAFTLPLASENLHIPCKIVRSDITGPEEEEHVLGIEFSYQTEAQMVLIDNFIRNMKTMMMKNEQEQSELRTIPRISCNLTGVTCSNSGVSIISIDNISTEGCLISYEGSLNAGAAITLDITLPGDRRRITSTGTITYVIHNYSGSLHRAGLCFSSISDIDSTRIQNYILKSATSAALQSIQERRNEHVASNEHLIRDPEKINTLLTLLKKEKRNVNILFEKKIMMFVLRIMKTAPGNKIFTTQTQKEIGDLDLIKHHTAYCSFYLHGSSYYFKSELRENGTKRLAFAFPTVLHRSDKRSYERRYISDGMDITLEVENAPLRKLFGKLVNVSRRGFLCNVKLDTAGKELIKMGQPVSYFLNKDLGLDSFGEIRHIKEKGAEGGELLLEIGVEAGIRRKDIQVRRYSQSRWNKQKSSSKSILADGGRIVSEILRYNDRTGKQITALLNRTGVKEKVPVVILPPAFGKKKETLSPLVATLLENFRRFGKDVVTIRYDGINRPGESYHDDMCPKRGYEMLRYRISQGLDDLEATMDYACDNVLFKPAALIVVAFSMSALDARKLAVRDKRVSYLINVMGVTCGRSSFNTITGGIDIIDNARIGIRSGLSGILGHILDLDTIAKDLIENRYAYLADARHDMSRISIPVSWIYGKYDKWVIEREIRDLMSVKSKGFRELIEIPTGHNLRSSEDAIQTFKIVTQMIFRHLEGKNIRPFDPDRTSLVDMITCERERLYQPEDVNIREYWRDYLIGDNRNSTGYDFYRNFEEFKEFLSVQASLMELKNGETMADMGCGTGIFMERMLINYAEQGLDLSNARLMQIDLVAEALARTREKYERIKNNYGPLVPRTVDYIQMDLEPNRLLPVKRFMNDPALDYSFLRNRVEGLKNTTIDRLLAGDSERLRSIMRGASIGDNERRFLKSLFNENDSQAVLDVNRAARLLSGNLVLEDLASPAAIRGGGREISDYKKIRTDDIKFTDLNFGNKGLALNLSFRDNSFDKISASLLISYLFNPDEIVSEFFRILKPGGRLLVSSMRLDSDLSVIFTNYIDKVLNRNVENSDEKNREMNIMGARAMLNEAASLLELEEDGHFRFYSGNELAGMMGVAGFKNIRIYQSMGNPPQAVIVTGDRPANGL